MNTNLASFTDVLSDEIANSQPLSLSSSSDGVSIVHTNKFIVPSMSIKTNRPAKGTGQCGQNRSTEEIDPKYRHVFSYPYFNQVQSNVIEDGLYSDKSIVVCAPTGSGKTVIFEMAIVQLLMELEDTQYEEDFKIIYMAPVKALCTERLTEWYPKFTKLGLMCIEVTGDTEVDFSQLKPYKIIITTPEKWDILTRRWRDHRALVEVIKLFLIDEVHILNDCVRGPVLEAVVSRMKTIESSAQSAHRIEKLQKEILGEAITHKHVPRIRFVAVSATVSNPEDVAHWLGSSDKPAVYYKYGDECRPVKLKRVVEGYLYPEGASMFKFDIILNYKLWPIIQRYHSGKPTLIFCNTRKSVVLTAETLSRELTINFNAEQKSKLTALAATIKNKKLQALVLSGVGCHHAGLLYEERMNIELAFRNKDLPILITTTTLAMGVNLPAHLVIIKNTQQYVNGAYQEYSISTVLQMVGRAGRPQYDTEATAVIMTRLADKARYQSLLGGCEPLQSYLHKRLAENLNSEAALGTVGDVAQCVQWLRSTFLYVRALQDPRKYLGLPQNSPEQLITKKIEELCVRAMNGLSSAGLITMDEASCIESTEAGRLMSLYYLDLETMKNIMKIEGSETLESLLLIICESHELADMHLRVDERRTLNALNRSNTAATIRFPMKGKISTRQMKLNCIIQAVLGCLPIADPSLNQEAMKVMRIAQRVCKCLVAYITRKDLISMQPQFYVAVLNSIVLAKCVTANLWENSPYMSKQLKGIGTAFSTLLASAGKTNFTLLEESHPRDLERLMNKGPPAGNLLRKQISLLPKYKLTMLPRDEKTVVVQLILVNQAYLMENMDNLTAGSSHKSYIVVGDSENNLLLLASFKDKDLITVFDGTITYEIRRKHNFEHKIFVHCISSQFVGIDDQIEYNFNSLESIYGSSTKQNKTPTNKQSEKQTCITDTFKERKRKSTTEIDKSSKEKKIKKSNFVEHFKPLQRTLEDASKMIKGYEYQKSKETELTKPDENIKSLITHEAKCNNQNTLPENNNPDINTFPIVNDTSEQDNDYDCIDDDKIASILIEIEKEMLKDSFNSIKSVSSVNQNKNIQKSSGLNARRTQHRKSIETSNTCSAYKNIPLPLRNRKFNSKSNYTFLDLLEKNVDLEDNDKDLPTTRTETGFSEAIKEQIQQYLINTQNKGKVVDKSLEMMLNDTQEQKQEQNIETQERDRMQVDLDSLAHDVQEMSVDFKINTTTGEYDSVNQNDNSTVNNKINSEHTNINNSRSKYDQKELLNKNSHSTSSNRFKYVNKDDAAALRSNELRTYNTMTNNGLTSDSKVHFEANVSSYIDKSIVPMSTNLNDSNALEPHTCDSNQSTEKSHDCGARTLNDKSNLSVALNKHEREIHGYNNQFKTLNLIDVSCDRTKLDNELALMPYQHDKEMPLEKAEVTDTRITDLNILPASHIGLDEIVLKEEYDPEINTHRSINDNLATNAPNQALEHPREVKTSNNTKIVDEYRNKKRAQEYNTTVSNEPRSFLNRFPRESENQHINKYSYSATKIDVSNKKTTDCHVQVIKKVKLSYDITEIITPCVRKTSKDFRCAHNLRDRQGNSRFSQKNCNNDNFTNHRAIEPANDIKVTKSNESQIELYKPNNKICHNILSNSNIKTTVQNNEAANLAVYLDTTPNEEHRIPDTNLHENIVQRFAVLQNPQIVPETRKQDENESFNNISNTPHNNENDMQRVDNITNNPVTQTETYEQIFKCNKSVQNVLQKYLNIAGEKKSFQSSSSAENKTPVINTKNKSGTEEKCNKPRKPFKISDIHQLEVDLPKKLLVEDTTNTKTDIVLPEVLRDAINKNYSSQTNNNIENENTLEQYDTKNVTQNVIHNIECATPNTSPEHNLELEVLPTSSFYEDQNFELGMNMFDPKTLLQCVVNEDYGEVIPPPPEFVDQDTYLPEYNNFHEREFMSETRESIVPNEDHNDSIFADQFPATLTPSKEIETWTLELEDNLGNYSSGCSNSPKAFTVMRRNTLKSGRYDLLETPKNIQQNGLDNFKFTHKSKWKARK